MLVYTFDRTLDGLLTAVFDAFALRQQPEALLGVGAQLPLFCEEIHNVITIEEQAARVWKGGTAPHHGELPVRTAGTGYASV